MALFNTKQNIKKQSIKPKRNTNQKRRYNSHAGTKMVRIKISALEEKSNVLKLAVKEGKAPPDYKPLTGEYLCL